MASAAAPKSTPSSKPSSSGPTIPISILSCQESDVPTLARIAATSMAVDLVHRAVYPSNNPLDITPQQTNQERELNRSLRNPDARIFKAVAEESGEIVGYALFRFEGKDSEDDDGAAASTAQATMTTTTSVSTASGGTAANPNVSNVAPSTVGGADSGQQNQQIPQTPAAAAPSPAGAIPGMNTELMGRLMQGIRGVHAREMGHKRHVWWTSLMVLPSYQRKGIGTALMRHGFEELGADKLPIWLVTQVRGRQMYQTLGFEDVDVVDVDFSEFVGKYKGFGVHRNVCMVRQPRGVPSAGAPRPHIEW